MDVRRTTIIAFLVNILLCVACCNGRPFPQDVVPGALTLPSTATTVGFNYSSTTSGQETIEPPWSVIILFGTFGFIIFAGFLTWLGGKIYVTIFGMPQLVIETRSPCHCRRCRERREETSSVSSRSAGSDQLGTARPRLYENYTSEQLSRLIAEYRARRAALRDGRYVPNTVMNLYYFDRLPFNGVDDLAEALGLKSNNEPIQRMKTENPKRELPRTRPKYEPIQGRKRNSKRELPQTRPNDEPVQRRKRNPKRELPQTRPLLSHRRRRVPLMHLFYPPLHCRPNLQTMTNLSHLGHLPFFWVDNLAHELNYEPNVIRKYYLRLLPFYGVMNWEEVYMASWEITLSLMSVLPFRDVSDEVLRECACSSVPKMSGETTGRGKCAQMYDNMEAAVSSPKEPFCPEHVGDFVHYEDEIEKGVSEPVEISY